MSKRLKELIDKFGKEKVLEMALKIQNRMAQDIERKRLHDAIQERSKLAISAIEEMLKNPYTVEEALKQVKMLNDNSNEK